VLTGRDGFGRVLPGVFGGPARVRRSRRPGSRHDVFTTGWCYQKHPPRGRHVRGPAGTADPPRLPIPPDPSELPLQGFSDSPEHGAISVAIVSFTVVVQASRAPILQVGPTVPVWWYGLDFARTRHVYRPISF